MEFLTTLHEINRSMARLDAKQRPAIMYHLGENPPFAMVRYLDGREFKIEKSGQAYILLGGYECPIPGQCPEPSVLLWLNCWSYVWNNRSRIPLVLMIAVGAIAMTVIFSLMPETAIGVWIAGAFSAIVTTSAVAMLAMWAFAAAICNFGRGVSVRLESGEQPALLPANFANASQANVSPHLLICSDDPNEDTNAFAERMHEQFCSLPPRGQYMIVLRFRDATGVIVRQPETGEQVLFRRDNIRADVPGWQQEVCEPRRFDKEAWSDFVTYVDAFCDQFREWVSFDLKRDNPLKNMMAELGAAGRKAACVAALLLIAGAAYGQGGSLQAIQLSDTAHVINLMDSVATADRIHEMERTFTAASREIWGFTMQAWDFVRYCLELVFYLLLCVAGLTRYAAKAANNESRINYFGQTIYGGWVTGFGKVMTAATFFLVLLVMLVLLTDIFIRAMCGQLFGVLGLFFSRKFVGVLAWFWLLNIADNITDKIVPNPKVQAPTRGQNAENGQFKRIG